MKIAFLFLCIYVFLIAPPSLNAQGQVPEGTKPLAFEADGTLEYVEGGEVIIGRKNVRLTYGDVHLKAEEVRVNLKEEKVVARGEVVLTQDKNVFKGSEVEYSFKYGKGTILKFSTVEEPWQVKGEKIDKVGPREYWAYQTQVTSCEYPTPHYYFQAQKIKLWPHERIWMENAVLCIGKVPVFYLPLYTRSLKGKPYGLVVSPGYDRQKGSFLLSHYNWFINPDLEGRIYLDPVEREGLGRGLDLRYGLEGIPLGYIYAYQMREDNLRYADKTDRWKIHARHWQDLGPKDNIFFEINKFSDKNFNEDFYAEEKWRGWKVERLKDYDQQNVVELSHREKDYTFTILGRKQLNSFYNVIERLPEVNFDWRRSELGPRLYFDLDGSYVYLRERPGWAEVHRGDGLVELSRPTHFFGWLNVTPAISDRITWYSRGQYEKGELFRHYYGTSIGLDTRLYKTQYTPEAREIEKKRHVVEPRLTYYYYPDININQDRLFNFDGLDRLTEDNRFNFQLINRLQGKKKTGETIEWLRAISETNYDLNESSRFKDLRQEFLINPQENVSLGLEAQYDFLKSELEMVNSDIYWQKGPWQVSLGSTYYLSGPSSNLDIEEEILWNFSPLWRFSLANRYDLKERHLEWHEFSVYRDLHCWEAQFIIQKRAKEFQDKDELRFYLAFNIKALPNKIFGISETTSLDRRIRR